MASESQTSSMIRVYAAEMLGTAVLVFLGCGSVVASSVGSSSTGLFGIATAFGLAVAIMIYAVGPISGAHINPAVTVALAATGHFPRNRVFPYVAAQCAGAIAACVLLMLVFTPQTASRASYGATAPAINATTAFAVEVVLTFILMYVIMAFATDKRAPGAMAALAIGGAVVVDILVGGPVSGASMNPARSLGPAIFAGGSALSSYLIYLLAPIAGAVAAAFAYEALRERTFSAEPVAVVEQPSPAETAAR